MRQKTRYLAAGTGLMCLILFGCPSSTYAQSSQYRCREELLKREEYLKQARSVVQIKLDRMYERINRMKLKVSDLENGLAQIDDQLRKTSLAIVDLSK